MAYLKHILIILFICSTTCNLCFCMPETKYSQSLTRMEKEWLNKDFSGENEEIRLNRLEEYVFGTIHDVDFKTRYKNLQKAFDARKHAQYKNSQKRYHRFSGVPTSIPMNIEGLTQY